MSEFWARRSGPPSSPDCNPLDYFIWCVLKREVKQRPCNIVDQLKTTVTAAMAVLSRGDVIRACRRFRSHLKDFVEVNSNFIE